MEVVYIHDACHTATLVRCRDDITLRFMSCRFEIASSLVEPQSCSECKLECINHVTNTSEEFAVDKQLHIEQELDLTSVNF